jgi:hypothetical protein
MAIALITIFVNDCTPDVRVKKNVYPDRDQIISIDIDTPTSSICFHAASLEQVAMIGDELAKQAREAIAKDASATPAVNLLEVGGCTCGAKFTSTEDAINHACPLDSPSEAADAYAMEHAG